MTQPQKGICAEPNLHAQYLLLNVVDDDTQAIREKLARTLALFDHYDEEHYEAMVTGVIAVGTQYWPELYPEAIPLHLYPFPDMQCEDRCAPATPCDLFIQIRADRQDICYALGLAIMDLFRLHVELVDDVHAFRYLDGRDLTGFLIAPNNPRGMKKQSMALIGDDDPEFCQGSFVHVQRFRHDLRRWSTLTDRQQEQVMGVTREHHTDSPESNPSAHFVRMSVTDADREPLPLINQSMPFGDMHSQGLMFVSFSSSASAFKTLLHSRIFGDDAGEYDRLLDFVSAETGAAFFAPSIHFIRNHAVLKPIKTQPELER
ncbi:Dyp-type peroxidase [Alteromonas oceanisediminis]|uniref:Dyp-type peroxidase n=1 Tax=Alteromonas oceanisediminis TaxID=2836180 RepID=UPI001BDAC4B2|nr:Dyp-type peroxidase [Alteromonas oceanisediminis]MBT0586122.1 Dyp-type peroxidase [Alteromonas oceanisediminis]